MIVAGVRVIHGGGHRVMVALRGARDGMERRAHPLEGKDQQQRKQQELSYRGKHAGEFREALSARQVGRPRKESIVHNGVCSHALRTRARAMA